MLQYRETPKPPSPTAFPLHGFTGDLERVIRLSQNLIFSFIFGRLLEVILAWRRDPGISGTWGGG